MRALLRSPWAILLLLPMLPLWKPVFLGETIGPWAHISQSAPWNGPAPERAWDVLQADSALQSYVWRDLVLSSWRRGEVPLWNAGALGGIPLLANSQSGALYPPHVLLGLAHVPTGPAGTLLAWFHLAWAGLGAALAARRLGADPLASAAAGGLFSLSPWMVAWTPLSSVVATASWIPWCVAAAIPGPEGVRRWRWLPLLAACMLLAGHVQIAFYGLAAAALAAAAGAEPGRRLRATAVAACCLGLGVVGAWPQLGPSLAAAREGHRVATPSPEGARAYGASALSAWQLAGIAYPNVFGLPGQVGVEAGPGGPGLPGYWPMYVRRGDNFAESALACGPFALACLAWAGRGRWKPATWLAALGLALALGPLSLALYWLLPGWAASGSPGRASVVAVLGLCLAAGVGLSAARPGRIRAGLALAVAGALVAILASAALGPSLPTWLSVYGSVAPMIAARALVAAFPGILAGALLSAAAILLWSQGRHPAALLLGLGAQLTVGILTVVPSGQVPTVPAGSPLRGRVAFVNQDWSLFASLPAAAPPNTARLLGVVEAGGYDSLLPKDSVLRLAEAVGGDPAPAANGNMMLVKPGFRRDALAALGVDQVASRSPLQGLGKPQDWSGLHVYRLPGPGRASTPAGPARVVEDTATSTTVVGQGPGTLTLRDANPPGWHAIVDGKMSAVTAGTWRTVQLPEGEQTVRFVYLPAHLALLPLLLVPLLPLAIGLARRQAILVQSSEDSPDGGDADAS